MEKERLQEMSRFVVVGLAATAVHYAIYYLLLGRVSPSAAFTLGYFLSFLFNYALSSRYTFHVGASVQRFVSFGVSHAMNYFIQIILLNLFIGLGVSEPLAPLPVYAIAVPVNYLMVRFALTRRSQEHDAYRLFLMVVGFAMLWLNLLDVPTLTDDMVYRFLWHADESAPVETIEGIGDLLRSQYTHYMTCNGRFVVHLLAQTFLVFLPPVVLQVANTLMFVLLLHLATRWVCRGNEAGDTPELPVAVVVCTLLFIVFRGLATTMLWGLGAFNYLWPLAAVLTLLVFLVVRIGQNARLCPQTIIAMGILALLAGWSHEALSLPVSIAFAAWLFANRKRPDIHKASPYMLLFMVGTMLCLLSPGVWGRAGEGVSLSARLLNGAVNCLTNIRVTWLLFIVLAVLGWRDRRGLRVHLSLHRYEYVALAVAFGIVVLCGTTLERVAFFLDFMAMLLLLRLAADRYMREASKWVVVGCCVLLAIAYVPAYIVRSENAEAWRLADEQMREPGRELIAVRIPQKGRCALMDQARGRYVNPSFSFGFYCSYMGFDATDINMRCAARLYGKERLVFLPEDVVKRIETDSTAYTDYELDANGDLYVWRMTDDRPVTAMTFILNDEDVSQLMPHQRLVAYKGDSYELDDFNFEVVHIAGRPYLVFTKPTTNIYRRIKNVEVSF